MVQTTQDGVRIQSMVDKLPAKFLFGGCLVVSVYLMVMLIIGAAGLYYHYSFLFFSFLFFSFLFFSFLFFSFLFFSFLFFSFLFFSFLSFSWGLSHSSS